MNIQDIIAQAQAAASPTIQPAAPTGNTPVPVPSLPTPQQAYAIQASQSTGQGAESADALEYDLRNLNALQLMQKYGYEMGKQLAAQRAVATQQVANDLTTPRTVSQLAGDVVSDVGAGAVNLVGGTAALGAGVFNENAGTSMAGAMNDFNEFVRNNQSPAQRAAQRNVQARSAMGQRDSKQQMDQEIAEGDNETGAGIRRVLRDVGNSLINTAGNSTALGSLVAQGVGSALPTMGISSAAGALSRTALSSAVRSGALTKAEATALMAKGGSWGTAATIGSMEAGGAYQQAVSQVMEMPDTQLVKGSPEFRTLLEQGVVPSEAKKIIANKAGLAAAGMTAPFAIALGRTVAKFEADPLAAISLSGAARNVGMQTLEEAAQGGGSQFMGNVGVQAFANQNQDLSAGVGEQIGTGALAGTGMAGVMQVPGVVGNAVASGVQAVGRGASRLLQSVGPAAPTEVPPPVVQPTLSMPVAVQQATEVMQQAPAVTERMVQEIETSNATPEEKAQRLSLVQQLNQGISYSPDQFDAFPRAAEVPELKEYLSGATNLLEAIQATGNAILEGKLEPEKATAAVAYLDQLLSQAEAFAGSAEGDALITQAQAATADPDAQAFLSAMGQVFQNMETSTELNQYREQARKVYEKQAAPTEVNADTAPEIVSRATHAPHTLQHSTVQDLLAQHDAGTIQLSDAQVMRLRGAAALTQAMDTLGANTEQGSLDPIVVVTRQVGLNQSKEEGQKYASVAEHHQEIVNALAKGDLEKAKQALSALGNLAKTFNNKVAAINQYIANGAQTGPVKYQNWVPSQREWREAERGLSISPGSARSRLFANQVAAETMLAVGTYNNLAEQFSALEATPIPLVQLDQRARTATTTSKVVNKEAAPAAGTPQNQQAKADEGTAAKKEQPKKPGQKAISELTEAEIMDRIQHIERNNSAASLANNTVYQALRSELKLRSESIKNAEKQRKRESEQYIDPNSAANAKVAPNAANKGDDGIVNGPKDPPEDTDPNTPPREASAASTPEKVILSGKTQHVVKDQKKADKANKFIGRGSSKSSTNQYAQDFGDAANTGVYNADDVVFLSVEGNRTGRLPLDRSELKKATDAGATIITDIEADRNRPYNIGEREAAEFLAQQNYVESKPGEWKKSNTSSAAVQNQAPSTKPVDKNAGKELNMVNSLAAALGLPAITEIGDNPESRGADYSPADNRMRVDPRLKGNSRISVILHELGHHAAMNVLAKRLGVTADEVQGYSDEQMLEAFRDNFPEVAQEYDRWLQDRRAVLTRDATSNAPRTPLSQSAIAKTIYDFLFKGKGVAAIFGPKKRGVMRTRNSGFHEWLADNIGKALEENQTTQGIVGQFFKRVANVFRKLYATVMADPTLKNFAPAASVQEWLQKVLDRSIEAAPEENQASIEVLRDADVNEDDSAQVEGATPFERAARLLKSSDGKENLFVRLFKLRSKPTRYTTLKGDAYDAVMDALSSVEKFQAFTGSNNAPSKEQLEKAASYFNTYGAFIISNARDMVADLLAKKVPVKGVNMTRLQVLQAIQAGEKLPEGVTHPDTWKEGLGAFNTFVDPETGTMDEYFLTAAGIAAAQWMLTSGGKGVAKYSESTVADMLGIPADMVTDSLRAQISAGFSHLDLIRGIADQIERYLGVEAKNDVPVFRAQSLSTSLAVVMLESMVADNAAGYFMDTVTMYVDASGRIIGKEIKTFEGVNTVIKLPSGVKATDYKTIVRYIPIKPEQVTAEAGFSSIMDQLLNVEPENALYFDKTQLEVSNTQLRSPVPLTAADKSSQAKLQETPHKLNPYFAKLIKLLPVDALKKILGGEVSEEMNKNHAASADGKGVTVSGSRNQVEFVLGEITTQAAIQGKEPHEVEVFYKYEIASQGRAMMQGKYNPQSDKVMRNLIMPMIATLDLNDTEHRLAWDMASLQMLGERTYAMQPSDITARAAEVFGQPEVQEAIAVMQRVLQDEAVKADEIVEAMQKAAPFLEDGATPEAMHVLLDRARFQMAEDVSAFESRLYLEADGVANGPAGAMAMTFSGGDLVEYVRKMRKAGFFIGEPEMVMANHRKRDGEDLYTESGKLTAAAAAERLSKYGESNNQKNMKAAHLTVIELMAALFPPGSITFKDGELTIKRSVTKNPMTVTVYGSGARGIAGKLLGIIEGELYERMTNAMRTGALDTGHLTPEEFKGYLEYLTTNGAEFVEAVDKDTGKPFKYWTMTYRGKPRDNFLSPSTFKEFTFTANERKTLQDNIHHFFVKDMVKGIEDTVGQSVMDNTKAMIAATTIQNHMVQHAFNAELEKLYAQKRSENSEWDPVVDGLTKKDFKALEKSLAHLNIALRTEKQEWEVGSSEKATDEGIVVTKSPFNTNRFKVPAIMRQPGGAGVQVVPYLVIGMGDAAMVQNLQNDPNAPNHLQVFDGINLGLNDIKNGGAVVNKAMADAWLNANPVKVVAESLRKALSLGDWDTVFNGLSVEEQNRIIRALNNLALISPKGLLERMEFYAEGIDQTHSAIKEVGYASDQMASTGVAHVVEGTVNSDSEGDIANALTLAITDQKVEDLATILNENKQGNLNIFEGAQIQRLVNSFIKDAALRALAQRALDTNLGTTLKDMKVVIGSVGDLQAGGHVPNANILEGLLNGSTKGFWNPQTRTLVMLDTADQETLAHELVHASTLEVLYAHISGDGLPQTKWGDAVTASITALENIFTELVEEGWDVSRYGEAAQRAYHDMMSTIKRELGSLEAGLEAVPAANRMNALNEMMAWSLSNQRVKEISKLQKFKQVITAAIGLLKKILFGPDADKAPRLDIENVFQQINFHTQALMHANGDLARRQAVSTVMAQDTLQHSIAYGNDDRLADIGKSFHQRVGQYLAGRNSLAEQVAKEVDVKSASMIAAGIRVAVQSLGMVSKPQEAAAFMKIVRAMATQAQIDPLVLNEAQSLYKQAIRGLKVEHFLENENDQDPAHRQAAQDKLNFILGSGSVFTDSMGRSSLLPVFIALGLTDPTVRMALSRVNTESGKQSVAGDVNDKLTAVANNVMRALQDKLVNGSRNPKNVNDALDSLAQTLIDDSIANANLIEKLGGAVGGVVDTANQLVVNALSQGSKKVSTKATSVAAGTKNRAVKTAAQVVSLTANIFNEEGAAANAEVMIRGINKSKMPEVVRSVIKDLTGRTKSNAGVYDMIKIASSKVSKVRQFFKEQLPSTLKNAFKKEPTTEQWTAMFKGMAKVDLASLVQGVSQATAFAAFDKAERTKQIAALEQAIKVDPEAKRILQKAKQLANYMVTGEAGPALLANADAVAHIIHDRAGSFRARKVEKSKTFVAQVDRLITLYALDQTPQDILDAVVELNKQEPEAMKQILGVLKAQRETDQARRQGAARFNAVKGYIPSIGSDGASLVVENDKNMAEMKRKGYTRVANYTGSTIFRGSSMGYYYSPVSGKAPYNQGIFQNARLTSGGVDVGTGFAVGFPTAGRITQKTTVDRLAKNMHADTSKEALRPIFAEDGSIIAFERSIAPAELERLNPSTHLALMLGQWMGRQAEEELAHGVNLDAMARVYAMWNNESATRKDEYINVLDPKQITDPVMRDALSLMPKQVRDEAERLFGKNTFMVRRDVFEDLFGYRDASFSDFWNGNSRWSPKTQETVRKLLEKVFGPSALATVMTYEQRTKNVIKDVRTLIVVKSVVVPAVNLVANIFQMMATGVPMSAIVRGMRDKTLEVDAYMKSNLRKMDLQVELLAAKGNVTRTNQLTAQIQSIEDSHRRLSIWPLIEAGELGSISDVGISRDELLLSEGKLQEYLEAKTEKLPQGLKAAGKNFLLTKDTALFQGMQKAMEYGDFLAKAIVYEHQLSKGMSKADALGLITDEFVNYDRLPGRVRGSLENFGLAWFWNYKLRIAKTAFRMIRQDPLRVALLAMLPMPIETPISENVFTKLVEGNLGYSLGPGMAFDSLGMNPWINAMN